MNISNGIRSAMNCPLLWAVFAINANAIPQRQPPTLNPAYGRAILKNVAQPQRPLDALWIWSQQTSDHQLIDLAVHLGMVRHRRGLADGFALGALITGLLMLALAPFSDLA